jgi:hypothetical protein
VGLEQAGGEATPKISFVFGVHNPSYAGDLLGRTQRCLRGLVYLANRFRLAAEIVIVEWNPDPGQPAFREGLTWPDPLGGVRLRFIEVPAAIHRRFPNADRIPIFEYLAKNVGLRRARGQFLLATNPDLFYSAALVTFLARRSLAEGRFYRVDRSDLDAMIPSGASVDAQLRFCHRHVAQVHAYFGSFPPRRRAPRERHWGRWLETQYEALRAGRPASGRPTNGVEARLLTPHDGLHRNASGDFFLMARRHWHDLRGYPELYTHSHIDAILCWIAASAGLSQRILPSSCRLYHQHHDRVLHAMFPQTDWRPWYEQYLQALQHGRRMDTNGDDWGLVGEELPEWEAGPAHSLQSRAGESPAASRPSRP